MTFTARLVERARGLGKRIAFPEGDDPRVAEAARILVGRGVVEPVLLGAEPADAVRGPQRAAHPSPVAAGPSGAPADSAHAAAPLQRAVAMLRDGAVDGVVAGAVHTSADVILAGLKGLGLRPGVRTLSSSFFMEVPDFRGEGPEVLTFTDAGVVPAPRPRQLASIASEAVRVRRLVVGDEPRVAFLSYSTLGSAGGRSVEQVREGLRRFRELCPEVVADGELQADAALVPQVARAKSPGSSVVGDANVLVFPSLDAANIAYKLVQRLAGARAFGPILQGLKAPLSDLSRGASVLDIVHVAAITALLAAGGD